MSGPVVIITHGDHDGMVCAILLLRCHPNAALRFGNDRTLARDLHEVAKMEPVPAALFITDIALGAGQHEHVRAALQAVVARGTTVRLFDHHTGWRSHPDLTQLCATFCVDERRTTAAVLVKRECLPHDVEAGFWLSVLSRKQAAPDTATHFDLLGALQDRENYGRNEAVLRALAEDHGVAIDYDELVQEHRRRRSRALAEALAAAETLTTTNGRRVGWLDRRGHRSRVFVGEEILQAQGWDLAANVTARKVILGSGHIDRGLSLRFLHGTHDVGNVRLRVAGHDTPVAIMPLDRDASSTDFIAAARELIIQSI